MKGFNLKTILLLALIIGAGFLFLGAQDIAAQTTDSTATVTTAASLTDETGVISTITGAFASVPGLAAFVLLITAGLKKITGSNDTWTIILSAFVSGVCSLAGWYFQWGVFSGLGWIYVVWYGLAAMAIANGLSTWSVISALLTSIGLKVNSTTT